MSKRPYTIRGTERFATSQAQASEAEQPNRGHAEAAAGRAAAAGGFGAIQILRDGIRRHRVGGQEHEPAPTQNFTPIVLSALGGAIGLLSGLTGVGGGVFLTPALLALRAAPVKQIAAITAPFILLNSLAGLAGGLFAGRPLPPISLPVIAAAALGGAIGSQLGAFRLPVLADLVPPPRKHRHRYHGVFAPNHRLRKAVTALAKRQRRQAGRGRDRRAWERRSRHGRLLRRESRDAKATLARQPAACSGHVQGWLLKRHEKLAELLTPPWENSQRHVLAAHGLWSEERDPSVSSLAPGSPWVRPSSFRPLRVGRRRARERGLAACWREIGGAALRWPRQVAPGIPAGL
jgi:hypothetical protein